MSTPPKPMWFDPQFRAKTDDLRAALKNLGDLLIVHERTNGLRERARKLPDKKKFYLAVEALACNLLLLKATGSDSKLAVPRSHGFLWQGGRNSNPVYGQHFLDAIDLMASLQLIHKGRKGYRFSAKSKLASLIAPADNLSHHLPLAPPDWRSIHRIDDPALIILKEGKDEDGHAAPINYKETKRTKLIAGQIKLINKFLRNADIEVTNSNGLSLGKDGQIVAPYRRSLRRIFNNANWQHGGRLAGGFWMSMERDARFERVRIDGERIADVDYRQLFPRLAYVRAGAEQPEDDIYNVTGDDSSRAGWKMLMNALLFADGPLKNWPKETLEHFPKGTKLRDAIDALRQKHAPIAHLFGTGLGFELMGFESDMLITVITHLFKSGVTALPLHDAVLVAKSRAPTAKEVMQAEFRLRTGSSCAIVSIEVSRN
jgi:hypothetical protein